MPSPEMLLLLDAVLNEVEADNRMHRFRLTSSMLRHIPLLSTPLLRDALSV